MKPLNYQVPKNQDSFIRVVHKVLPHFYDQLHFHPEWQISLILKGEGTLFAGNAIHRFQAGDLIVLSSGLAHLFKCDPAYYNSNSSTVEHLSLYFYEAQFEQLSSIPELTKITKFLHKAKNGLVYHKQIGKITNHQLEDLITSKGLKRFTGFFEFIQQLANTKHGHTLCITPYDEANKTESLWLNDVIHFSIEHYKEAIKLEDVATIANMSLSAFCKSFKIHTSKSYISFLNELRIKYACELLKTSPAAIAQVATQVGFSNLSNFNRRFKSTIGLTPRAYIKEWK